MFSCRRPMDRKKDKRDATWCAWHVLGATSLVCNLAGCASHEPGVQSGGTVCVREVSEVQLEDLNNELSTRARRLLAPVSATLSAADVDEHGVGAPLHGKQVRFDASAGPAVLVEVVERRPAEPGEKLEKGECIDTLTLPLQVDLRFGEAALAGSEIEVLVTSERDVVHAVVTHNLEDVLGTIQVGDVESLRFDFGLLVSEQSDLEPELVVETFSPSTGLAQVASANLVSSE